jgi:PEP-CTERM motif
VLATTISLTDNWSVGTVTGAKGGKDGGTINAAGYDAPTLATGSNLGNSNVGSNVTTLANNTARTFTIGTAAGGWLFVAQPSDPPPTGWPTNYPGHTSYSDIQINFQLTDGTGGTGTATAYLEYFADSGSDKDDMVWTASAITPSSSFIGSATSLTLNKTLSDGAIVQIVLPYETDWNMAQAITLDVTQGPTDPVPEPASFGLFGLGLLGTLVAARCRRA